MFAGFDCRENCCGRKTGASLKLRDNSDVFSKVQNLVHNSERVKLCTLAQTVEVSNNVVFAQDENTKPNQTKRDLNVSQ